MISLTPEQVRALSREDAKALCGALREELIRVVSETGGHLASNLGIVEIAAADVDTRALDRYRAAFEVRCAS